MNSARNLTLPNDNSDTVGLAMIPTEDAQVLQVTAPLASYPDLLTNHLLADTIHGFAVG
jgi:hypothetical protein